MQVPYPSLCPRPCIPHIPDSVINHARHEITGFTHDFCDRAIIVAKQVERNS